MANMTRKRRRLVWLTALLQLWILGACGSQAATTTATPITLYTCVNDATIQPVIQQFEAATRRSESRPLPGPDRSAQRPGRQ